MLKAKDQEAAREFLRAFGIDPDPMLRDAALAAAEEKKELLSLGIMRAADPGRYELVGVFVKPELAGQGLERQMVLTLELEAGRRRARWFGVWLKSDVCDDFALPDLERRLGFLERGYVFRAYRADHAGPGRHEDRLDRELRDVLESAEGCHRRRLFSEN